MFLEREDLFVYKNKKTYKYFNWVKYFEVVDTSEEPDVELKDADIFNREKSAVIQLPDFSEKYRKVTFTQEARKDKLKKLNDVNKKELKKKKVKYVHKNKKTGLYYMWYDIEETEDLEKAYSHELTIEEVKIYINNSRNPQAMCYCVLYNQELRSIKLQKLNELHI